MKERIRLMHQTSIESILESEAWSVTRERRWTAINYYYLILLSFILHYYIATPSNDINQSKML